MKNIVYKLVALFLAAAFMSSPHLEAQNYVNLEEFSQDFVLETKRINIPGYPNAFNPSIIRWHGRLLMSFRDIPEPFVPDPTIFCSGPSKIGLVWLDDDFNPVSEPQILDTCPSCNQEDTLSRSEDARLVIVGDVLYLVYSDNNDLQATEGGFRMFAADLSYDGTVFTLGHIEHITDFPNRNDERREKNWVPFDYYGALLFSYSIMPHKILYPLLGTGDCAFLVSSRWKSPWKWGEMRGGTPAVRVDSRRYISFFHSSIEMRSVHSNGAKVPHYFMGAYTFASEFPFQVTHVSPSPIIGKHFYEGESYTPYWKPVVVVFPCGIIIDRNIIWVSYGRQDHELWVAKIDKRKLLGSLAPIEQ